MSHFIESEVNIWMNALHNHHQMTTWSRDEKPASRYFFTFFVHAEDTISKIALGVAGFSEAIALWQEVESAPIASKRASFPCYIEIN